MLRGNHECRQMTAFFNFKMEVEAKYDESLYDTIMESFDALPLSCIVNDKFIAIHGGISPELKSVIHYNISIFYTFYERNICQPYENILNIKISYHIFLLHKK